MKCQKSVSSIVIIFFLIIIVIIIISVIINALLLADDESRDKLTSVQNRTTLLQTIDQFRLLNHQQVVALTRYQ